VSGRPPGRVRPAHRVTPRKVNNWCGSRTAVPKWEATLAVVLAEFTPEALAMMLKEAAFSSASHLPQTPAQQGAL
jgi:hypothetical protein